jgi:putative membrane-bound dehydrogenase-like protein
MPPFLRIAIAVLWLYAAAPAQSIPAPAQSIPTPKVLDDVLRIELFASEPDILTPTGIAVDAQGRAFVVECNTHQRPDNYQGPPTDRIRVFEDTDRDGRADKIGTFFEGTQQTMNLALHTNGWFYVATRREIFRLRDTNDDGVHDERETLMKMETAENYPHNGLSGFAFDFAGTVYFGLGENFGQTYRMTGTDGRVIKGGEGKGAIFRCTAEGKELHCVASGFWNPFHLAFDDFGRLFAVDNDPGNRPPCRLLYIVEGGDYGYRRRALEPFISWDGELPGMLPMIASTGEAPTSIVFYNGGNLPLEYDRSLLVASWGENRIDRYRLTRDGASFRAQANPLVVGGQGFRPSGMAIAPDGSIYVADWADRSYPNHGKGRIWRLSSKKHAGLSHDEPGIKIDAETLAKTNVLSELCEPMLTSRNPEVREGAVRIVRSIRFNSDDVTRGNLKPAVPDAFVQGGPVKNTNFEAIVRNDPDPGVRAAALRRIRRHVDIAVLAPALADDDPYLRQAAREALGFAFGPQELASLATDERHTVRLGSMLILRDAHPAEFEKLVPAGLADDDDSIRFIAIQFIGDHKLESFRGALMEHLRKRADTPMLFEATLAAIAELDGVMDKWKSSGGDWWKRESNTYDIAAELVTDASVTPAVRGWALRMLPDTHKSLTPERLEALLASEDKSLRIEAVRALIATRKVPPERKQELLSAIAKDTKNTDRLRGEAIDGLDAAQPEICATLVELAKTFDSIVRDEALRTLRGAPVTDEQVDSLNALSKTSPAIRDLVERVVAPMPPAQGAKAIDVAEWIKRLAGPADAAAGERVFFHRKGPGCANCHTIEGRGNKIGPEFTRTAGRVGITRERLIESILLPSKEVSPAYVPWTIVTTDGLIHTGIFHKDDGKMRLFYDGRGEIISIKVPDIEEMMPSKASIMPENLGDAMTLQEFRDLIAFLSQQDELSRKP